MKFKTIFHVTLLLSILVVFFGPPADVFAQEGTFTESFEDESLPGWEQSEGAIVTAGVMQISPGNFAVRFNDFSSASYSFEFKQTGPGLIVFRYAIGDGGEYTLIMNDEAIVLERAQDEHPNFLAESPWEQTPGEWQKIEIVLGESGQQISLDGNHVLSTEEDELLSGGGVGFWVEGETPVEFDNLTQEMDPAPAGVPEKVMPAEAVPPAAAEDILPAAVESSPARLSIDDLISELTSSQANPTQLSTFLINLLLAVVLSYILSRVYVHWGSSLSNRRRFAANFILITVTTTFIILVVRSSVALSLGLVGALSIVRFRSAIKEPEELAYLFFAISIGIGLGDNQRLITVIALAVAILVLGLMRLFRGRQADFNLHVTVSSAAPTRVEFESIVDTLRKHTAQLKLMRFDESNQGQESSFLVEFRNMSQLKEAKSALLALSDGLEITFLDNKGIW